MTTTPQHPGRRGGTPSVAAILIGVLLAAVGACGGGDSDPGEAPDRPSEAAGSVERPDNAPADTASGFPADTPARPGATPAAPDGDASAAPDGASGAADDGSGAWSTETRTSQGNRPAAELVGARAASHDGYDRLVLEFRDRIPGYTIGYVAAELRQCGSGQPVDVAAPYALIVALSPAAAHDEAGNATATRSLAPGLPVLRAARIICDFEGGVEWVVQAERRVPLRVLTLRDPARLVIDLRSAGAED